MPPPLPPLKPISIKDRVSVLFVEKGQLDVFDGFFVLVDKNGLRTHLPVGNVAYLMLEPGIRVSHAAPLGLRTRADSRGGYSQSAGENSRAWEACHRKG